MNAYDAFFIKHSLSDEQLRTYEEQGYLPLGCTLTDAGLEQMRDQCMAAWRKEKGEFDAGKTWLENALLCDIHHRADLVRQYYFNGPLVDVAQQLIGSNIKAATSQLTFKMRGNTKPFGWHQDNGYGELNPYNALTTLTALDDADEENGCLWLIPASHRQKQIAVKHDKEDISTSRDINLTVDESHAIPVPMKADEAIVFHCWMLHKSQGNFSKDRDRRILFLRYADADADAVEVYNDNEPRLGRLLRGSTQFEAVRAYEKELTFL